ncbi:hypothetical protein QTP70_028895, partial [Hemibagrus guttatus]
KAYGPPLSGNQPAVCASYDTSSSELRKVFDTTEPQQDAAWALFEIFQGGRWVTEYYMDFRMAAADSGWNSTALYNAFYGGLTLLSAPTSLRMPLAQPSTPQPASPQPMEIACHHHSDAKKESPQAPIIFSLGLPILPPMFNEPPPDLSTVLLVYYNLGAVFSKAKASSLLPRWPYDCAIDLLPCTIPPRGCLSGPEQDLLITCRSRILLCREEAQGTSIFTKLRLPQDPQGPQNPPNVTRFHPMSYISCLKRVQACLLVVRCPLEGVAVFFCVWLGGHIAATGDMPVYQMWSTSSGLPQGKVMAPSPRAIHSPEQQAEEATRKREVRLMKNRQAARECRQKKKEYVKCLENRVAVLENQNKTLIEELRALKGIYCHKPE